MFMRFLHLGTALLKRLGVMKYSITTIIMTSCLIPETPAPATAKPIIRDRQRTIGIGLIRPSNFLTFSLQPLILHIEALVRKEDSLCLSDRREKILLWKL